MPPAANDTHLIRPGTLIPSAAPGETIRHIAPADPVSLSSGLELGALLGEGGMGEVHRATQRELGREVAVKAVRPELRGPKAEQLLLQEAWATGALEHPNIVPVYTITRGDDGSPLIVLKRIDGHSWRDLIRDGPAVTEAFGASDLMAWNLSVLEEICGAVHFAHTRGILHRDLKPSNVMIDAFGEVYLMDWGLAVSLGRDCDPSHRGRIPMAREQHALAGTPYYMAPEMLQGDGTLLSPGTDLYLLGGILYEILTGAAPHAVSSETQAVLAAIPDFIPLFPDDVPPILEDLCASALSADPTERPKSALAFVRALQTFQTQRGALQLVSEAQEGLARLRTLLATPDADRDAIYRQLGACRFGFQQALRSWPEHRPAQRGLRDAVAAVATAELEQDALSAAEALLRELSDPPPELVQALATHQEEADAQAAAARKREQDADPTLGLRTRVVVGVLIAVSWTVLPAAVWMRDPALLSNAGVLWATGIALLSLGILTVWGWDSLTRTAFNRRILAALFLAPTAQILLSSLSIQASIPPETSLTISLLVWSMEATLVAIAIDRRIALAAVCYLLAFIASTLATQLVLLAVAGGNLGLLLAILTSWGWASRGEQP
jgi:hypothetical protein